MIILKRLNVSTLKIAATYIGIVVGAGFATGQELLQFFVVYGVHGLLGIALTTFLFILFGFIIMNLGHELNAKSHLEILKHSSGAVLGFVMDILITLVLFGSLTAMIAGTGALFNQYGVSGILGSLIIAVITTMTVLFGIKGVINSVSIIVPFLLVAVIVICLTSIAKAPPDMELASTLSKSRLIDNWALSALNYASYNIVISIAVLGPLGAHAKNKKAILHGAILGGLGLGLGSLLICLAIFGNLANVADLEVPMAYIAGNISYLLQIIFTFILIAEVYTTAVGSLYGFNARLFDSENSLTKGKIIATAILAFLASLIGFSNLVKYFYPLVGYGGILLLISLLLHFKRQRHNILS